MTTYRSTLSALITNNTPSGTKKHCESVSSAPAHCFYTTLEFSQGSSNWSLNNYGFICNAIFFTCTYARKGIGNEA